MIASVSRQMRRTLVTERPQAHMDSSQVLAANGVDLAPRSGGSKYADSGVIVKLGRLSSLFHNGSYVKPKTVGSSDLAVNFYFGTNGGTKSFGTLNSSSLPRSRSR